MTRTGNCSPARSRTTSCPPRAIFRTSARSHSRKGPRPTIRSVPRARARAASSRSAAFSPTRSRLRSARSESNRANSRCRHRGCGSSFKHALPVANSSRSSRVGLTALASGGSCLDPRRSRATEPQRQDTVDQRRILEPVVLGRRGELLVAGNFGIGVGLDVIGNAVDGEAEIDAGIAVEVERAVDALRRALDRFSELRREVLGRAHGDVVTLLVLEIVLDLFGGDEVRALRHAAEVELPDRKHAQPLIAKQADVKLAALDILLGNGRSADAFVDEADALGELVIAVHDRCLRDAPRGVLVQALDDEQIGRASCRERVYVWMGVATV